MYTRRFPQEDSHIREFLVSEMCVHAYVSLHSHVYNFLNCLCVYVSLLVPPVGVRGG